jgi:hypothetical protein
MRCDVSSAPVRDNIRAFGHVDNTFGFSFDPSVTFISWTGRTALKSSTHFNCTAPSRGRFRCPPHSQRVDLSPCGV